MHAEIIAVGTEMLLGEIVDTNSKYISEGLADLGIDVYYHSLVGDNETRMEEVISLAAARSDLVILSGGLGPTPDDLTKQVVARFLQRKLVVDQVALRKISAFFEARKRTMTPNNKVQAMYIDGAVSLPNEVGLAVGNFYHSDQGADFLLLPGPPHEMETMFDQTAKPLLASQYQRSQILSTRLLRFYGIGESNLVTKLADLIDEQVNPTIAPYAKETEVTLRLTATGQTEAENQQLLDDLEEKISARVGRYLYGYGENNSLPAVVVEKLKQRGLTISAAESLTGGSFQAAVTAIPGASAVFPGGFVTYAAKQKEQMLGIDADLIERYGVVSEQTARAMAERTLALTDTDLALSFTGVAGPEELEGHPAGTVWIGLAGKQIPTSARLYSFQYDRSRVRNSAVMTGFSQLYQALAQIDFKR
ncbi:damage-inducible protein CinA [Ligilactobacillus salitolerans]|uniref:Putative competence-damage inducible protein n=1 Tax=Ligilactobacillus salitolerans TaxID=1808352 RepID=A0A401ISX6_9LACO|nr:competence/damage-inducible protein A [Ligilactobacillus salitolerans]GBG94595.1 damage-inducible protein CinA [Ligilactobacillus salitolerans]